LVSHRATAAERAFDALKDFNFHSRYGQRRSDADICDFTFGNPHEMPLAELVSAIREGAVPLDKNWFAYKTSEEPGQIFLADALSRELDLRFEPPDVALTTGAFAAISVALRLLLDAGDEAVFCEPGWFCYEPMMLAADIVPRKIPLAKPRFDLDLGAIDAAIGPRTRLVIVNTPHNPTGRIYEADALAALAEQLERASSRIGRRIFLLSDEPYRRLRFDGRGFTSPAAVYPWTLIAYSYGKVLLAPGQRLGYLAISPLMPTEDRQALRDAMFATQMAIGWCFPNAVMQNALPQIDRLSIDVQALTRRRDALSEALAKAGHAVLPPEGTFYLWAKWASGDPDLQWNALADNGVFVMPGRVMNAPDYFRISLTASDDMVARALPAFSRAP
jgi:aspartate aminotransferase